MPFNTLLDDPTFELLRARLQRLADELRTLPLSTKEEFEAEVYSRINSVLRMGTDMMPLATIARESPALIGDFLTNLSRLNQDGTDVAAYILRVEDAAAKLYNLAAASQNSLRQDIRESAFQSNQRRFQEAFLNATQFSEVSGTIDVNAGSLSCPVVSETQVAAQVSFGSSTPSVLDLSALSDGQPETAFVYEGSRVELVFRFPKPVVINRIRLEMDDYQSLDISTLETSDGNVTKNVLTDLDVESIQVNAVASKYSGDTILDFPPRYALTVRMVIEDLVGEQKIAIREISFWQRKFASSGKAISNLIQVPQGTCQFLATQQSTDVLTAVTHQISFDESSYQAITPGQIVQITGPFRYQISLERANASFNSQAAPVASLGSDPLVNPSYVLKSSSAVSLGNNILQRVIKFTSTSGPIPLREVPIPGTIVVQTGTTQLAANQYTFADNVLTIQGARSDVTISYQTSSLSQAALPALRDFYSPLVSEVIFEAV